MKKIIMLFMALCMVLPALNAQNNKARTFCLYFKTIGDLNEERVQGEDEGIQKGRMDALWLVSLS